VGGTTDHVAFDHHDLGPESGGVGGCGVPGRATADDDETNAHVRQATSLCERGLGERMR
jgi:hypothetical protein